MHKITFTKPIDMDTLWQLKDIFDKKLDLGVLGKSSVQCQHDERDIVTEVLDNMGIEYTEGESDT